MRERVVEQTRGNEAGRVADVGQEQGAHAVGDLSEALVVPIAAVGRGSANEQLGLLALGRLGHLVHVDGAGLFLHPVKHRVIQLAAVVHRRTVGQVTTVGEIKAHDLVARLQASEHHGAVRAGTTVRLDIGPFRSKQLTEPLAGDVLHLIDHATTAVVSLAGETLGVLVGQDGTLSSHDLVARIVLGGDELDAMGLAFVFLLNELGNDGVAHDAEVKPSKLALPFSRWVLSLTKRPTACINRIPSQEVSKMMSSVMTAPKNPIIAQT